MNFTKSQTYLNLLNAYAGECQARTRYEFVEYGARMQGYEALAQIVDKIAYQEFNHARMFYTALQQNCQQPIDVAEVNSVYPFREKWDLVQNLQFASADEHAEGFKLYPSFAKVAQKEGFCDVATLFTNIANVEKRHEKIFSELYSQMKNKTLYKSDKPIKWKCPVCGYEEVLTEAWQECPVCKSKQGTVMLHLTSTK